MSLYKSNLDELIADAQRKVRQMEKCGQYHTSHHEQLARLLAIKTKPEKKTKVLGDDNDGRQEL